MTPPPGPKPSPPKRGEAGYQPVRAELEADV